MMCYSRSSRSRHSPSNYRGLHPTTEKRKPCSKTMRDASSIAVFVAFKMYWCILPLLLTLLLYEYSTLFANVFFSSRPPFRRIRNGSLVRQAKECLLAFEAMADYPAEYSSAATFPLLQTYKRAQNVDGRKRAHELASTGAKREYNRH